MDMGTHTHIIDQAGIINDCLDERQSNHFVTGPAGWDGMPVDVSVTVYTQPLLIGIAGPKRAGKDTLARALCRTLALPQDSFAAPLRRFVADLLGWSLEELEARKEDPIPWLDGITPRHMMQTVGTEWGRDMVHGDLWVRALLQRLSGGGIISDVRFANEARAIRERGGIVIQVNRPGAGQGDEHVSEKPLPFDLVDVFITNDSTREDLAITATLALRDHFNRA